MISSTPVHQTILYLIRLFLIIQNLSKRNWIKIAYNNSNIYVNYSMFMRDYKIVDYGE